jgi:mannitol/fructose-specific phosphotransferase system IIA component (Ntr-type)
MDLPTSPARLWLHQWLLPSAVELNLRASNRDEVLVELAGKIAELGSRPDDRQALVRALLEREQLHSTGVGDGVALPHARNALVGLVKQPVIVFGRHAKGIPFGAIDAQPVRLFFLLVATSVTQHLQILARISRLLRDPRLRANLLAADKAEQVVALLREAEQKL